MKKFRQAEKKTNIESKLKRKCQSTKHSKKSYSYNFENSNEDVQGDLSNRDNSF